MTTARKHSRKRDAILDVLRATTAHPAAERIYSELKPEYPDLSLGTVYRNLAMFKKEGLIESLGTIGAEERFDGRTDAHSHFICTACEAVYDLDDVSLPKDLCASAEAMLGVEITGYRLHFYGLCPHCREKQKN